MDFINQIFNAGIVGCGGAGFPTHVKLNTKTEYFILNGAECEPLLYTDRWLMIHKAGDIVRAASAIAAHLCASHAVIALKTSYAREIRALEQAITEQKTTISIFKMASFYPAGDEQMIVHEVTGRTVPPGGIPLDVGAVVSNIATVCAVAGALDGTPFTEKYLTVTGLVSNPCVIHTPLGAGINECIATAGGAKNQDYCVLLGGPMMGKIISKKEAALTPVTKTTSGIVILPAENRLLSYQESNLRHTLNRARAACIQCTFCTELCPRYLLGHPLEPHRVMRALSSCGSFDDALELPEARHALLCCECGVCELFACPMQLQPRKVNMILKQLFAQSGIRYEKTGEEPAPHQDRESRKVPTKRAAVRAGVGDFTKIENFSFFEQTAKILTLPLRQHIGKPALPVVSQGEKVARGQLIAACPENGLGANLHAPVAGTVVSVDEKAIMIEAKE
ncbi:MAG: 4Fe-4S dicluster domain-containing protein [Oscillospiraceae bacterium]|jgi:Na+-translocating ferredoxin:NAD+ oxidoreductase RnfC subunit|nr:4Fe-4S dicluster domain-containing protein [Oscillospiraceae bacterium]